MDIRTGREVNECRGVRLVNVLWSFTHFRLLSIPKRPVFIVAPATCGAVFHDHALEIVTLG